MGSQNGIMSAPRKPLFSFGVISDVQYADIPDWRSFIGVPRYYRHSILVLQSAVQNWNNHQKLKFVVNFGDIVDGFCPMDQSLNAVKKVLNEFNRFVVLDGYDISAIGWPEDHPNTKRALNFLKEKNPNSEKNSPEGLVGLERRFLKFNGAVGKEQLGWLDCVLRDATKLNQKVVVCCHLPLDPGSSFQEALLWNYDVVMDVIHRYNCVKVCLGGHDHKGGHSIDSHGVRHRVLEAAWNALQALMLLDI